jgi:hypothetical protein
MHGCYDKTGVTTNRCYDKPVLRQTGVTTKRMRAGKRSSWFSPWGTGSLFIQVSWAGPSSLIEKVRPQLTLQPSGWRPDPNDPDWREIRSLK